MSVVGNATFRGVAAISASGTLTVVGKILGEDWTNVSYDANTWSATSVGTNNWTPISVGTNSWTPVSAGSNTWTTNTAGNNTWQG